LATIDITRAHSLGKEKARQAAEQLAEKLRNKIQIDYKWNGDVLSFNRKGADGKIHVADSQVRVEVDLGLLLRPMKGSITDKINQYLDTYLVA